MMQRVKLYVVPHTHIDLEWYWTLEDTKAMMPTLFYESALRTLERDSKMTLAQDQVVLFDMLLRGASEEDRILLKEKIQTGHLEPVGGMYVQPELQEPCGESLINQIQIGQRWMEQNLGRRATCAWLIDSFGQIRQLPQILNQSGFKGYVFMRDVREEDEPAGFPTDFWYEGPDGSRILTHWLKNSYVLCESGIEVPMLKISNVEVTEENEKQEIEKVLEELCNPDSLQHKTGAAMILWGDDLYCNSLDTFQIRKLLLEAARRINLDLREEDILFAVPSQFFEVLQSKGNLLPVRTSDFDQPKYRQDLRASFVSRIGLKQKNRKAEQALLSLENLTTIAGEPLEDAEELWKLILFNQFHDVMGGSCLDESYLAAMRRYEKVIAIAEKKKQALFGVPDNEMIRVFNPTQFIRTEPVTVSVMGCCHAEDVGGNYLPSWYDSETNKLTFLPKKIGPYGVETCCIRPGIKSQEKEISAKAVENIYYYLRFDLLTGNLISIWDKMEQREVLCAAGNVFVVMEEKEPDMEGALCLTGVEYREDNIPVSDLRVVKSDIGEIVQCRKVFHGLEIEKWIYLWKDCRRIDFVTGVQNNVGEDMFLQVEFPLAFDNPQSVFETPFGESEGWTGFHCAQKFAALREGSYQTALLNQGTGGYWVRGNRLGMALLRSYSNYTQYRENGRIRGLSRFEDDRTHTEFAAEYGYHRFHYALVSGKGSIAAYSAQALMYNSPLEAFWSREAVTFASPIQSVSENFIITRLYRKSKSGFYLRGYHAGAEETICALQFTKIPFRIRQINLLDEVVSELKVQDSLVRLSVRPFEIVTLYVEEIIK